MTTPQPQQRHPLRRPMVFSGIVLVVVLAAAGGLWLTTNLQSRAFNFDATIPAGTTVRVNAGDMDVSLHPAKDGKVQVHAHGGYRGTQPHVDARPEPGGVVVDATCDGSGLNSCRITLDVDLPVDNAASVVNTDGDVHAASLTGHVSLVTTNGDIRTTDLAGDLNMRTENGEIQGNGLRAATVLATTSNADETLNFVVAPTTVTAHTTNGDVTVSTPGTATYHVEPETTNGDVNVSVPKDDSAHHLITATSMNGDITVRTS